MPRIRRGITPRKSNIQSENIFFVIASEGAETERIYFEALNFHIKDNTKLRTVKIEFLERGKEKSKSSHLYVMKQLDEYKKKFSLSKEDELWLVIDRDKQNNPVRNIRNIAQKCLQKGFNLALSNPNFEFWLLLHLKNIQEYSKEEKEILLENPRIAGSNSAPKFLERELATLLGSAYSKSKFDTAPFMRGLPFAMQQAEELDNEERWHENQLGTRVYLLIKNILKI